jgi:hypothetical protein
LAAVLETPLSNSEIGTNDLIVGSDEEKALVKAVKASFPNSKLTLCTRHLEENLKRQLKNKIGMPEKNIKTIVNDVFGPDGLTNQNTSVDFDSRAIEIERKYKETVGPYLSEKLVPSIKEHIHVIQKSDDRLPLNWKNNHCEAMNHIFKLNLNWKPAKLPDLIQMLEKEIKHQEALTRGALYGHGDYELAPSAMHLRMPLSVWQGKSENEKQSWYSKFLRNKQKIKKHELFQYSTDGKLVMPKTTTIAKKPGQKRRLHDAKTMTVLKRPRTE